MEDKDLKKVPIMDMFELLINSGETESLLDAIRKERGADKTIETKKDELDNRQLVMKKLISKKDKGANKL